MIRTRCVTAVVFLMMLALSAGCSKKQEQKSAAPQGQAAAPQLKPATAVPDKDKTEARAAASHVLAMLQAGEFPKIYAEAAPGFQKIGPEAAFVTKFQQTRMRTGTLSNPRELSFNIGPEHSYVMVYRVENERYTSDWRLSFTRSPSGKLELAGLNQHDELKKK